MIVFAVLFVNGRTDRTAAQIAQDNADSQAAYVQQEKQRAEEKKALEKLEADAAAEAKAAQATATFPPTEPPPIQKGFYIAFGFCVAAFFFTGLTWVLRKHKMDVDGEFTGPSGAPDKQDFSKAAAADDVPALEDGGGGGGGAIEMVPPSHPPPQSGPAAQVYNPLAR